MEQYVQLNKIYNLDKNIRMIFVGDIMLSNYSSNKKPHLYNSSDTPGKLIKRGGDPFADFADILQNADITIGNLECCITTCNIPVEKSYNFKANPRVLPLLKKYFSAISLANNHTYDFGTCGFMEMLDLLNKYNLPYFGGGLNMYKALEPIIFNVKNKKIAILGYNNSIPNNIFATENTCSNVYTTEDNMKYNIMNVKNYYKPDYIIIYIHWGSEYKKIAMDKEQLKFGHLAIDSGADIVIGHHPHVTQNITIYKDKPIFYSLGNFVFHGFNEQDDTLELYNPIETSKGWVLELILTPQLQLSWIIHMANLDKNGIPKYGGKLKI